MLDRAPPGSEQAPPILAREQALRVNSVLTLGPTTWRQPGPKATTDVTLWRAKGYADSGPRPGPEKARNRQPSVNPPSTPHVRERGPICCSIEPGGLERNGSPTAPTRGPIAQRDPTSEPANPPASRGRRDQNLNVTRRASEVLNAAPPAAGSRNQYWKYVVSPGTNADPSTAAETVCPVALTGGNTRVTPPPTQR